MAFYVFKNNNNKTIEVSIEPLCEEYVLNKNEELVITSDDDKPIDITVESNFFEGKEIIVLNMNNILLFYNVEIRKQN